MSENVIVPKPDWDAVVAAFARAQASVERTMAAVAAKPAPAPAAPPLETTMDARFAFKDYGAFYDSLRGTKMLGPKISEEEFEGCDRIISACARAKWGVSWTAYALGTTYHEVNGTMQPVKEIGGPNYFTKMYDIRGARPAKARELGNLTPGDGARFPGRGYVQLTGKANYVKATKKLREMGFDVDLVANPERAMEHDIAAAILVAGMREGWFTGRDIDDDLPATGPASFAQFVASRDIINGRDKDDLIAGYAVDFQTALIAGGYTA